MTTYRYLQPLDVLFLRGNRLFGDPGSFGKSLIPPWPSVAAGAIRSQILARDGVELAEFAAGVIEHPQLGTPSRPGPFAITDFRLARRDGDGAVEPLYPIPADLLITRDDAGVMAVSRLNPRTLASGLAASACTPMLPVLSQGERRKPLTGYWLGRAGWQCYLDGGMPKADQLIPSEELWKTDARVGIGLNPEMGRADDGKLFAVQAAALTDGTGFLVGVAGAEPPNNGLVRLGGDGRGAAVSATTFDPPEPDLDAIVRAGRCRIVLTSPGIFANGWRLTGADDTGKVDLPGLNGRLACAAMARAEVVSGWDLANSRPKAAQRAAPAGSVYWIDEMDTSVESLRKLAEAGLWRDLGENAQRRAEGFNRLALAAWN